MNACILLSRIVHAAISCGLSFSTRKLWKRFVFSIIAVMARHAPVVSGSGDPARRSSSERRRWRVGTAPVDSRRVGMQVVREATCRDSFH